MRRLWHWPAYLLLFAFGSNAISQERPAPPDSPSKTATFTASPISGGVIVRNVSARPITIILDAPDLDVLKAGLCRAPYDYPRPQAKADRFPLATGAATCLAIKEDRDLSLTLHTAQPFYQVHLVSSGLPSTDPQQVIHRSKNGLALYAAETPRGFVEKKACDPGDIRTRVVNSEGNTASICLSAYGAYKYPLTMIQPGHYGGILDSRSLRTVDATSVPITVTVYGALWQAVMAIVLGVILALFVPYWQEVQGRSKRRSADLLEIGLSIDDSQIISGAYSLNRTGRQQYSTATNWINPRSDADFAADLQNLESFSKAGVLLADLGNRIKTLQRTLPNWSTSSGRILSGNEAKALKALDRVFSGEANYLRKDPQASQSKVSLSQIKPLQETIEEALRLAVALENLDVTSYQQAKDPAAQRLLHLIYQEDFLIYSAEGIKTYRTRLDSAITAAIGAMAPAALVPPPIAPVAVPSSGTLGTQAAPDAWVTLTNTQRVGWKMVLALSLIIAVSSGLLELYVGRPWGATAWDYVRAFLWGAGTGVSLVLAANLLKTFSGSALLGTLAKRVKL